jgi:predicted dinucleotide-binding enzyme
MNFRKVDAGLARALATQEAGANRFSVFVQTNAEAAEEAVKLLENLGVRSVRRGEDIYSAELSSQAIDELSEQPWIQLLTLSARSRPL